MCVRAHARVCGCALCGCVRACVRALCACPVCICVRARRRIMLHPHSMMRLVWDFIIACALTLSAVRCRSPLSTRECPSEYCGEYPVSTP